VKTPRKNERRLHLKITHAVGKKII